MALRLLIPSFRKNCSSIERITRLQRRTLKNVAENGLKDEPVKYSTSEAGKWKAAYTTSGKDYFYTPKSQAPAIVFSLAAFMIYFCILREENDLDDWLRDMEVLTPLQIQEAQLRAQIEQYKKRKLNTQYLEEELEDVVKKKEKLNLTYKQL